jgi:CheY-like chemotaxis protein
MERRATGVGRALALAIANVRPHAEARDVQIAVELDDDVGDVLGDPRRLRQIFDNLLSNAVKFSNGGRVSIIVRQDADSITIDVSDTGSGISADFLPHVFEAFRQNDERLGLGLGLAIARELVGLHGGTITAASDGIGTGATFTVKLPRIGAPIAAAGPHAIAGVRILLIDDDAQLLGALEVLLAAAGAVVQTALSASVARRILERQEVDIVVSDLSLPGEDGLTFMQRLREQPSLSRSLPAIAITALAMDGTRERALAAGFDRYITKPIDVAVLIGSIAELVR